MSVTGTDLLNIATHQEFKCSLTGVLLTTQDAEADHIVPISQGGKHEPDNIQIVHSVINSMKGTMTQSDFVEWCCRVADHARTPAPV